MEVTKSEKDKNVEELIKMGYNVTFESNIPIFHITDEKDAVIIRDKMLGKGSFGFKYPNNMNIITQESDVKPM